MATIDVISSCFISIQLLILYPSAAVFAEEVDISARVNWMARPSGDHAVSAPYFQSEYAYFQILSPK